MARELEAGTAQTAWSLNGSRVRWLARQIAPIAIVLGTAMTLAALVAIPVGDIWVHWGYGGAASLIGLHGPLAVVRAFGAFGVGLAVGALLGRTLPAFLFGAVLSFAVLFAAGSLSRCLATVSAPDRHRRVFAGDRRIQRHSGVSGHRVGLAHARMVI